MALYLRNLRSQEMQSGVLPWDFKPAQPIPEEVRADKKARDTWINHPDTNHHVYTFNEGVNAGMRISRLRSDGGGNPVRSAEALVADYDSAQPVDRVLALAQEFSYPPNWIEKTLSGNWRFVWLLGATLLFASFDFAQHFFKEFAKFGFDPNVAMIGFDAGAWEAPERLFTNSCEWFHLHDKVIPAEEVQGWLVKASQNYQFNKPEFGVAIPLDVVKAELEKRYTRFAEWPGEFALNSQGPSFWVEGSQSPKSAIVRETGIQTFAEHAVKGFYTWQDLLGATFCKKYESEATGRAVEGIYHDGKHYYRKQPDGLWKPYEKGDTISHLRVDRHVSQKSDKEGISDVDRSIQYIQNYQSVIGCAPFVFRPHGIIYIQRRPYLNTNTLAVLPPADGVAIWGANGQFPWCSYFLDGFFSSPEQLPYLLSWFSLFYKSGYYQKPCSGQSVFIAGPVGVGKTFLNRALIGGLVGGYADPKEYMLGKDNFGSELFEVPLWCIDDASVAADPRQHKLFSEMVKRSAANRTFRYHAKFRVPLMVEWLGRIVITCNADEESIRILPDLDISILDKVMLFRAAIRQGFKFPPGEELERLLARELPWLARFLLDYTMPEHCVGESRFGVAPYHEASLVETAQASSRTAGFAEILEDWRADYFKANSALKVWEGTSFQLHKAILIDPTSEPAMRNYSVDAVSRHLAALKNKGGAIKIECTTNEGKGRLWRIFAPEPKEPVTTP